jgi:hypothetical protein
MSNKRDRMPPTLPRRLLRYLGLLVACLFALALLGVVVVQVQERLLRARAQRLSADIRSLQVRQSTFRQAVDVFARRGQYGDYNVPCSREYCDFSIQIAELEVPWPEWEVWLFRLGGGRLGFARASISVREGIVWETEFALTVDVPLFRNSQGHLERYVLEGGVSAIPRSTMYALELPNHPEYEVGWPEGCAGCVDIWVRYAPYADKSDIDRIGRINFDCLTRWRQCRTRVDIMPGAMAQAVLDGKFFDSHPEPACTAKVVQIASRDAESAAIAEVLGKRYAYGGLLARIRLIKRLKRATSLKVGSEFNLGFWPFGPITLTAYASHLIPGSQVIALFDRNIHPRGPVPVIAEACGVIPLNQSNLRLVQSGIQQDRIVHLADNPWSEEDFWSPPPKFSTPPGLPHADPHSWLGPG